MSLSVIIPCYNVKKELINKCVTSILEQDYSEFEIILVDDGSDDRYKEFLLEISKLDNRIKLLEQDNKGVSAARNIGIQVAKGDYLVFVDADDYLVSYFFSEAVKICQETDAELLIGGNTLSTNKLFDQKEQKKQVLNYKKLSASEKLDFKCNSVGELKYFGSMNGYFGRGPWSRFIKKGIAKKILFDEQLRMGEDILWNLQLLSYCKNVVVANRIWYLYYINSESANHKYNPQMLENVKRELPCIEKELDLNNDKQLSAYCVHILDELSKIYYCYIGNKQCPLTIKQINEIKKELYREYPWKKISELQTTVYMGRRKHIARFLYSHKCYFGALRIRLLIKRFLCK